MSPSAGPGWQLQPTVRRLRRQAAVAIVLGAVGLISLLFAATLGLPPDALTAPGSALALVIIAAALVVLAAAGFAFGRVRRGLRLAHLASEIEAATGLRPGELRGAIELASLLGAGSRALARLQRERVDGALAGRNARTLLPRTAALWRGRTWKVSLACAAALAGASVPALFAPGRAAGAVRALGHPWRSAFPPPPPPIVLSPGPSDVQRGAFLDLELSAPGRRRVDLLWRARGELPGRRHVELNSVSGDGRGRIGPITEPTVYWAEDAAGVPSDSFSVQPFDPLLLTSLTVSIRFPAYQGRPEEVYGRPAPTLVVPPGAAIEVVGRANGVLTRAELRNKDTVHRLDVNGSGFSGRFVPIRSGAWGWTLSSAGRGRTRLVTDSLEIVVQRDLLPSVAIVSPGPETDLGAVLSLPLVIDARDDEEIRDVEVISWRASATHQRYPSQRERIGGIPNSGPRLVLTPQLDLRDRGLLPGDTLVYVARARDVNPRHGWVFSDTFRASLPSLIELRMRASARAEGLRREADEIRASAAAVTRAARDARLRAPAVSRASAPSETGAEAAETRSTFGSTEDGRQVLQRAEQMRSRLEALSESLADLREDLDQAGLGDPRLRDQLEQLQALTRELLNSGLKERIEALQRALQNLDEQQMRAALEALGREMDTLRDQLEQSVALLERVAVEQAVRSAHERADDLADRQEMLAAEVRPEAEWNRQEQRLANRTDSLSEELQGLADRLRKRAAAESDSTAGAGRGASRAAAAMRAAAGSQAGPRSAQAATELRAAADALESVERRLTRDWKQEALESVDRAIEETLTLAREQNEISSQIQAPAGSAASLRGRQAAVRQGLDNLMQSLAEAGRKTALLDRRTGPTAARAAQQMDHVLKSLVPAGSGGAQPTGPGGAQPAPQAEGTAVESLNELAAQLLATRSAVRRSESGTGMQEALEQMARMARAQGGINREGGGLLPLALAGQQLDERLQALAREQAAVAQGLREIGDRADAKELAGRPEDMAAEAEAIADRLSRGRLDRETVSRQEKLFRTLLDAGRSLERGKDPRRRESRTGRARSREAISKLSVDVASGPRFALPDESDLRGFSAAYRRMVFDYFARLNRGGPGDGAVDPRVR